MNWREDVETARVAMKRGTAHTGTDIRPEEWAALDRLDARIAELEVALREIAYDGPNPGSHRSAELQWAAEIARRALEGEER